MKLRRRSRSDGHWKVDHAAVNQRRLANWRDPAGPQSARRGPGCCRRAPATFCRMIPVGLTIDPVCGQGMSLSATCSVFVDPDQRVRQVPLRHAHAVVRSSRWNSRVGARWPDQGHFPGLAAARFLPAGRTAGIRASRCSTGMPGPRSCTLEGQGFPIAAAIDD